MRSRCARTPASLRKPSLSKETASGRIDSRRLTAGGRIIRSPLSSPPLRRDAAVVAEHAAGEQLDRLAQQVGDEVRHVARLAELAVGGVALPLLDQALALRPLLQQLAVDGTRRDAVDLD